MENTANRNAEIYSLRKDGNSFGSIATRFNFSIQRVRQIFDHEEHRRTFLDGKPKNDIAHLMLQTRTFQSLRRAGIVTIEQLIDFLLSGKTPKGDGKIRNFGVQSARECRDVLLKKGLIAEKLIDPMRPEYARLTDDLWKVCLNYWEQQCAACEILPTEYSPLHQDHWIPRTSLIFPGSQINNIIPLCWQCNVEKTNQDPYIWLIAKFGQKIGNQKMHTILDYFDWCQDNYD